MLLTHVIYGEEKFKKIITELTKRALTIINSKPFKSFRHQNRLYLDLLQSLSFAIIMNTLNTKHRHFSIEKEIRSIMLQGRYAWCSYNSNGWYFDDRDFIAIDKNKAIASYDENRFCKGYDKFKSIKLKSPKFETSALRSITLGPAHNEVKSTIILEELLTRNGFGINIEVTH